MKILVVEDDPLVADDLLDKLKRLDYRVTTVAESFEDALKAIELEKPDLVLLDIELKGVLTGIDLSVELSLQNIPFIYLTSIQDMSTYLKAKSTAPLKNLAKPIDLLNLRNAILELDFTLTTPSVSVSKERIPLITDKDGIKQRIDPEQIVYLKADRSYCDIHFEDGSKYTLASPMGTVLKKLSFDNIVPISRSCCVHLKYVTGTRGNEVKMIKDIYLRISESHKPTFNRYLNPL